MRYILILNYVYLIVALYGCSVDNSNVLHDTTTTETAPTATTPITLNPSQNVYATVQDMANKYNEVMACMGMTADAPIIQYVSYEEDFNGAYGSPWGGWTVNSNLIFVNSDSLGLGFQRDLRIDLEILQHEYIHYILWANGADPSHSSPMFAQCGLGVNTYN